MNTTKRCKQYQKMDSKISNQKGSISLPKKIRLRLLVDRWSPTVTFLFVFLKILQFLKMWGLKPKESGWRSAVGTYLRTEHAKFVLAALRLNPWSNMPKKEVLNYQAAKKHVIMRLSDFLRRVPSAHWRIHWSRFSAARFKKAHIDIVCAEYDADGNLDHITPYFDVMDKEFKYLDKVICEKIHSEIVACYNSVKEVSDKRRPWLLRYKLEKWLHKQKIFSLGIYRDAHVYVHRILSAVFIHFENVVSSEDDEHRIARFQVPSFIQRKHPGQGIFNIFCRFMNDCSEIDLWFQINHVPVDGVPMQEIVTKLEDEWGTVGKVIFPSLVNQKVMQPQRCSTEKGEKGMYYIHHFLDFQHLLAVRKKLNDAYEDKIGGPVTLISMLLWGLAHTQLFHDRKFLFPVDIKSSTPEDRNPGVVLIRPGHYINTSDPVAGFMNYQLEITRRLNDTKIKMGESYELLELYALTSPLIYMLTRVMFPTALAEFVGTVGITMIKDATFFIAPLSDIHTDGFIAIGNVSVPTEDGGIAGAVTLRGPQEKITQYVRALEFATKNFDL